MEEKRKITFPAKLKPGYSMMRGIGLREALLIGAAAIQAVYLIFAASSLALELRLTFALVIAIALLAVAKRPVRGKRMEEMFVIWVRGQIRPKRAQHQTSTHAMPRPLGLDGADDVVVEPVPVPIPVSRSPMPAATRTIALEWDEPSWAAVLGVFMLLIVLGSVLAYASGAGMLPKLVW